MRIFHEILMDRFIEGPTGFGPIFSKFFWTPVLGNVETLRFMVVADRVSGASLSLTLDLYDTANYAPNLSGQANLVKNLLSVAPNAGQSNMYQAFLSAADAGAPASYGYYFLCGFNGTTSPKAHVRIWVTGRGKA